MKPYPKYYLVFKTFLKNNLIGYMEYRANFFMEFISEIAYVALKLVYIYAIFKTGVSINGNSSAYILAIGGNHMILTGIFVGFFMMNFLDLSYRVRDGTLDFLITKPISLQFMISFRSFQLGATIPNFVIGIAMLVIGIREMGVEISFWNFIMYLLLMISSIILTYSIFLIMQLPTFWIVKTDALTNIMESIWDYNNMPMNIYGKRIIIGGIFFIPLFVISNFPLLALTGQLESHLMIWGIGVSVPFLILSRILWKTAIKRYSSASS
ncbi:ABC transporter permease [Paenibacillus assamensis]|uniref:ABC transporter permease n=1 Tax=Paenibacillus assamensis TaxID=311244 RepID=UPI00042465B8|nr:ABC-2 family transporter protein [Paenibacillus assamensis]